MLKRKLTAKLIEWKNNNHKKSLVVQGARQIGKTFIIHEFALNNYKETIEINFKEMPSLKEVFEGDLNVDNMIMSLRFRFPEKKFEEGNTIIFLDEIQECPEAITSLKFWTIDKRYDVIASGSLLGIDYNRPSSYPVGYVDFLKMTGLDFEEYLWAVGIQEDMIQMLRDYLKKKKAITDSINDQIMN